MGFLEKLKTVKADLKKWKACSFGHIEGNITALETKIHDLDTTSNERILNPDELNERKTDQMELWTWMKRRETYWAHNLREKWIKEGDRNTKYFHTLASIRKKRNSIEALTVGGTTIDNPDDIKKEACAYFKNIFREEFVKRPTFNNLAFNRVSEEDCTTLTAPFSHEEVDEVVASCDSQKAPGPDGFNFSFIKKCMGNNTWRCLRHSWRFLGFIPSSQGLQHGSNCFDPQIG